MDKTKAFEMMERSAAQGNTDAQNMLGTNSAPPPFSLPPLSFYTSSHLLSPLLLRIDQVNRRLIYITGLMLRGGVGCAPDTRASTEMLQRSAEKGHAGSRSMLCT